jgi:hypothetical protein
VSFLIDAASGIAHSTKMNHSDEPSEPFVRSAWSWVLLPLAAYLLAIPVLGPGALFVPVVIANAPLGIIGCFQPIEMVPTRQQEALIVAIHFAFWLLFVIGLGLRRTMRLARLRLIWFILVAALVMSVGGCGHHFGSGLRNSGNWH